MGMTSSALPAPRGGWLAAAALATFLAIGTIGAYRYVDNYWLYRGFAPPHDAAFVKEHGSATQISVVSPALGGRSQPVDVYLPPGYKAHPQRRYPVLYLLHGFPGRPAAFLATVRMGVVQDELVALHRARPMILVMPFGSTGSFTDKEWANGVRPHEGWETFVARDVVRAVDARYRTIRSGDSRAIAGLSEGGYAALNISIHHPGEFHVVESWSGYQIADHIPSVFGSTRDSAIMKRNSPQLTIAAAAPKLRRDHTYFWFYSGTGDRALKQNDRFAHTLARLRLPYRYAVVHGGHNWGIWRGRAAGAYLAASKRLHGA
jgi:enterochelin esterase-like enzyme